MKRKLLFLAFILISAFANAQYPLLQYLGSDSTMVRSRGGLQGRIAPIPFTDTAAANLSRIRQYPGALIYTSGVDKYWYRNATVTGWIEFTSSGGSTVNIYNSNGTLTGERTVDGDGNGLQFNSFRWFAVGSDSVQIALNSGVFRVTGMTSTQDTSTYKPIVVDPITGRVMQSSYWYGSGSGGSTDTTSLSNRINAKADTNSVWFKTGNSGTNPSVNYIGTNDEHGFSVKVNGSRAGFIGHANMTSVFGGDVILGQFAGEAQDTLHKKNTIIGHAAMRYNTVANQSVAVGNWAGHHTIGSGDASGARFVYVGQSSGFYNLSGYSNTGVGTFTLERQFNGAGNSAWGRDALRTNNDGDYNTAGGILSMAYAASGVDSIIVTSGGSGYTSATITISSPFTGSTTVGTCWGVATATAVISGGAIVGITVNDPGCGYSIAGGVSGGGVTIPAGATVTITGDGSGATATAVIGAPRYTTSIGTASGLYARMPLGGLYLGYNSGANIRYRDKYLTLLGTNTSVNSSLSLYTDVNKSIALGYGATVSRSNILEIGATGADGVGVNLRYNKNYGSASLDSIGLLNIYDSLGNNMLYVKSWRPYSGSTIVSGYTSNIIFGDSTAYKNPYNWNSVIIGGQAMRNTPYNGNTVSSTVIGSFGLYSIQGGTSNTVVGEKSLYSLVGSATSPAATSWNTAIGQRAAYSLVSGRDNFSGGQNSMSGLISGDYNTATGSNSLGGSGVDTTSYASAYGIRALYGSGRRDYSSAFGYQAGFNTVGTGNLFLGYNAGSSLGTVNSRMYIHNASGTPLIYGEFDTYKVQINGDLTVTDTLTGVTLDNADSSHRMATTAWVKRQGYGAGGGTSDGYVDGATFSTSTNTLTLTQTGASDVTVRIPPSYLQNPIDQDSLIKEVNDSVGRIKAVKVVSDHPEILVTTTRNDSINTHTLSKIYISEPIATFSAGAGFVADTALFTDSTLYGSFFTGQDSFYITSVIVVMKGQAGDSLGIQIVHKVSINFTRSVIDGGTREVNSLTPGITFSVSRNQGIPPDSWVWVKSPTVIAGKRPEYLSITLVGYKKWIAP